METPRIEADAVPTDYIPGIWEEAAPELQRAIDFADGEMSLSDVLAQLLVGQMQLWVAHEGGKGLAYLVTTIEQYPQQRAARVVLLAGSQMQEWQPHLLDKVERWAVSCGCELVEWVGRPGWVREMKRHGYHWRYALCRKRLTIEDKNKVLH